MKNSLTKAGLLFFLLLVGTVVQSLAQSAAPADFFPGKWEILVIGTPNGDAKLIAELVRKDGKLTGQLTNATDSSAEKITISDIQENGDKLSLAFSAQGYDVTLDLAKVDDDNLKGSVMNMFDAKAKRLKTN